ncbi:hypothetical protein C8J56DRAFT_1058141 [Mycena floridula]|nr:hypothetical protein C8J56DRAFT_1059066 [Mycena floridula]KAJ7580496.1 hypothetical protein C8J56DRAFT_1058141 [Mycena floridula]
MQFIAAFVAIVLPAIVVLGMPVERDFIPPITATRATIKLPIFPITFVPGPVVTPTV